MWGSEGTFIIIFLSTFLRFLARTSIGEQVRIFIWEGRTSGWMTCGGVGGKSHSTNCLGGTGSERAIGVHAGWLLGHSEGEWMG